MPRACNRQSWIWKYVTSYLLHLSPAWYVALPTSGYIATWSQYYDYKEAQDYQSYLAEKTAKDEADRHLAALRRRFSTEAAVEAWEHGDI